MVKDYSIAMAKSGHDVTILVLNNSPESPNESAVAAAGVPIISLGIKSIGGSPGSAARRLCRAVDSYYGICNHLSDYLINKKPDVLHFHLPLAKYVAHEQKKLCGTKLFYTCHSEPKIYFEKRGIDGRIDAVALRHLVNHANLHLIAIHDEMASDLSRRFGTQAKVVRNPVDLSRFNQYKGVRDRSRENLGIARDAFVVGHVGRFSSVKNHAWLVKVFSRVAELNNKALLLMIGDGEEKTRVEEDLCRRGLEGRFRILSNRSDVPALLAAMDVFCFPSKWEGYPISVLEAQAVGVRCVVSDRITTDVFVTEGNSRLSLMGSVDLWAEEVLGKSSFTFQPDPGNMMNDYNLDNVIKSILSLYEQD